MPLKITPSIEKKLFLTETDKKYGCEGDPTYIVVVQASQRELSKRNDMFAEFTRKYEASGAVLVTQRLSFDDIQREEAWLTMRDCNILADDGENSLFNYIKGVLPRDKFIAAWNKLPRGVADEIHKCVLEVNPQWTEAGEESNAGE